MDTILIIEAVAKHAELMRNHLEEQNFKVQVTASPDEAKKALEKQSPLPNILVVDLNIDTQEFFDFYRWLSNEEHISLIPRLFITGKMQRTAAKELEEKYRETILQKPLDINRFTSTITKLKSQKSPVLRKNREQDYFSSLLGKKVGPATIKKEVGRGGMGAVFLGYQESLDRNVAIKVLLPEMVGDETAIDRFQREALAIAKLKSPHIVQIFDFGEYENNAFYISMEYLDGQTIDQYLKRNGSFPLEKAISVIMQTATGLSVAHDAGLIHRDIKPSNLILDNKGHVTITDFGLVRPQKKTQFTQSGVIVGSPHYMAPEQMSDSQLDTRTDIYSLGIVFFHLISGHPPFLATNPMEILMKHLNEPLPDLRETMRDIPRPITAILERMTAKEPNARYINCRELIWDLKAQQRKISGGPTTSTGSILDDDDEQPSSEDRRNIDIKTDFHPLLTELQKQSPALFTQQNLQGLMTLTESGSMVSTQGKFPEEWRNAIFVIQEATKQINVATQLGQWKFKLIETPKQVLALFPIPRDRSLGTLLFNHKDTGSLTGSLVKGTSTAFNQAKRMPSADPLRQIAAIAGVTDVLLLDGQGQLIDHALEDERMLDEYKKRFPPVAQIIQSITYHINSMDLWFDKGRILAWTLDSGILFVVANLDISRSFLSIYITANLETLNSNTMTAVIPAKETKAIPKKEVTDPVAPVLMEKVQLELARTIGPIAKVVLSKECKKMGYTRDRFPNSELMGLVKKVSDRIEESKRQGFVDAAQDVIYDFRSKQ